MVVVDALAEEVPRVEHAQQLGEDVLAQEAALLDVDEQVPRRTIDHEVRQDPLVVDQRQPREVGVALQVVEDVGTDRVGEQLPPARGDRGQRTGRWNRGSGSSGTRSDTGDDVVTVARVALRVEQAGTLHRKDDVGEVAEAEVALSELRPSALDLLLDHRVPDVLVVFALQRGEGFGDQMEELGLSLTS